MPAFSRPIRELLAPGGSRCVCFAAHCKRRTSRTAEVQLCRNISKESTALPDRRAFGLALVSAAAALLNPISVEAASEDSANSVAATREEAPDLTVTNTVFLDIAQCAQGLRQDRRLGDKSSLCDDPQPLGRIKIGLYGRVVPETVKNFIKLIQTGAYAGTTFSKVLLGQYIQAGRQGSLRMGEVQLQQELPRNTDVLNPSAFRLEHRRPGTVSLSLSENDDDANIKQRPDYRNCEFLITTGPGPVPSLNGENIVFGRVVEGFDTIAAIASVPTFKPNERVRGINQIASLIGDERAAKVRAKYGKPLKAIIITETGMLS